MIELGKRIDKIALWGNFLKATAENNWQNIPDENLRKTCENLYTVIENEEKYNGWFIKDFICQAIINIANELTLQNISYWINQYQWINSLPYKKIKIAIIMAGNIPLVGFHDLLCVLITGQYALIKQSSDDKHLLPAILKILFAIEPEFENNLAFADEKIKDFNAVIATGSNNSARYFEYYFGKYPHIIRKNRSSIAILNGKECEEELQGLADDVFLYFGMGCRSVSKLYVPKNYDFNVLLPAFKKYEFFLQHHKFMNSYTYYKSIYLINQEPFLDYGIAIVKQENAMNAPIGVLLFDYYDDANDLYSFIEQNNEQIQAISSNFFQHPLVVELGKMQKPELTQYADGIDTIQFIYNAIHKQ